MKELFQAYLLNSIGLSLIGFLLFALSPVLSRRYSAKCRYSLWLVILFALILPVRPKIPVPMPGIMRSFVPDTGSLMRIGSENGSSGAMGKALDFWQIAVLLWVGGAIFYLLWYSISHLRFTVAVKRWSGEIAPDKKERFQKVKAEMGIEREVDIRSCACIRTPMMAGFRKPVILLPIIDLTPDELTFIIRHELVHYRRKDLYVRALLMLALIIHWYNPAVHMMVRLVLHLCEISCDEAVLLGTDSRIRARYGETFIGVIQKGKFYQTALSTNFFSGAKGMKTRIYAMMDMKRKRFSILALCIVSCVTFCGISTFALTAQSEQTAFNPKRTASTNSGSSTPKKRLKDEVIRVAELVHLTDRLRNRQGSYSGGMKQRILLAGAVMGDPRLVILDEPTAGLDPKERVRTRELIHTLSVGRIFLVATHIVSDIETVADEVILLKRGKIIKSGKPENLTREVGGSGTLEDVYLRAFADEEEAAL